MFVRFVIICDKCRKRSEEYGRFPTCKDCQEHVCPNCDVPTERTEDERGLTLCTECFRELILDAEDNALMPGGFN